MLLEGIWKAVGSGCHWKWHIYLNGTMWCLWWQSIHGGNPKHEETAPMPKLSDFQGAFVKRTSEFIMIGYNEMVFFNRYLNQSLKNKARKRRQITSTEYDIILEWSWQCLSRSCYLHQKPNMICPNLSPCHWYAGTLGILWMIDTQQICFHRYTFPL